MTDLEQEYRTPRRRFSTNSFPKKPNTRSFEIYYEKFVNLNKPVKATLLHFKTPIKETKKENTDDQFIEELESPVSTLEQTSEGKTFLHSYHLRQDQPIYRSCSLPNVLSPPPFSTSSSSETLKELDHNLPKSSGSVIKKNSFISNCIHQHFSPTQETNDISRQSSTCSESSSSSSWEDQLYIPEEEECQEYKDGSCGDLLKDTCCKRHHHRRGSVAIKFQRPKIVHLNEIDGSLKEVDQDKEHTTKTIDENNFQSFDSQSSWNLRESLNKFTLG